MNPRFQIWTGWDLLAIVWIIVGLGALAVIPAAITSFTGNERALLLVSALCGGPFFLLAGFGRRVQHISHQREHPRPFDAPD